MKCCLKLFQVFFAKFSHILHFPRFPHFPREIQLQSRISAGNEKCEKMTTLYTGLTTQTTILQFGDESQAKTYTLARDYSISIPVSLSAKSYAWFLVL